MPGRMRAGCAHSGGKLPADRPAPGDRPGLTELAAGAAAAMTQALSLGIAWAPLQALANSLRSAGEAKPNDFFVVATWLHDIMRVILVIAWFVLAPFVARWTLPRFAWRENRPSLGWFVLAGAVLGFTISIRQVGAFAGLLILIYWLRRGGKGLWLLGVYALVAGITTYATWPYLWAEPLQRFWVSLVTGAEFEIHMTPYAGSGCSLTGSLALLPTLAGLELTLPAVVLFLAGLVVAARPGVGGQSIAPSSRS